MGLEDHHAVALCELLELGIVRLSTIKVFTDNGGRDAPEGPEGVFQAPDEVLSSLPRGGLGITLEGLAQDSAEQTRTPRASTSTATTESPARSSSSSTWTGCP